MNIINDPTVGRRLAQLFSLKERAPVLQVTPEILPVCIVEDLRDTDVADPSLLRLCQTGDRAFGAVGLGTAYQLYNPVGSGVDAFFTALAISITGVTGLSAVRDRCNFGTTATQLSTDEGATRYRDTRLSGNAQLRRRSQNSVVVVVGLGEFIYDSGLIPFQELPVDGVILGPGQGLVVQCLSATNVDLYVTAQWYERERTK